MSDDNSQLQDVKSDGSYENITENTAEEEDELLTAKYFLDIPPRWPLFYLDNFVKKDCPFFKKRYLITTLIFIGLSFSFAMHYNIFNAKLVIDMEKYEMNITYEAAQRLEKIMNDAFFWSYLTMQIPGGLLAAMYPSNQIFGLCLLISFFISFVIPSTLRSGDPTLIILTRLFQGTLDGMSIPAVIGILRHWAPVEERVRLTCFVFSAPYVGLFVSIFLTEMIDNYSYNIDNIEEAEDYWYITYYMFSSLGILWWFVWIWFSYETPRQHPTISYEELHYIEKSTDGNKRTTIAFDEIPWKNIFTSKCVYAIIIANFCRCFNYFLVDAFSMDSYQPTLFSGRMAGHLLGIPFAILLVIVIISGVIADILVNKEKLSIVMCRKLFTCIGFTNEMLPYLIYLIFDEMHAIFVVCWSLGGVAVAGFMANYLDIAPRYASIIMGFSNSIGMLSGTSSFYLYSHLINLDDFGYPSKLLVAIVVIVIVVSMILFYLFVSGESQPWAKIPEQGQTIKSPFEIKLITERQKHWCTNRSNTRNAF